MKCLENLSKYDILKTSIRRYNMKICFVRHGQTDANKNGLIQGVSDHPLNETGIKQAKEAAKLIKKNFLILMQLFLHHYLVPRKQPKL